MLEQVVDRKAQTPVGEIDQPFGMDYAEVQRLGVTALKAPVRHLQNVIKHETTIISAENVIVLGVGRGYATALCTLLAFKHTLAGLIGIDGWIDFKPQIEKLILDEIGEVDEGPSLQT